MTESYIGRVYRESYPAEVVNWCNDTQLGFIAEIEPEITEEIDAEGRKTEIKFRRFEVKAIPPPTEEEIKAARIAELKQYLTDTDWYAARYAETGKEIPPDIAQKRQDARDEISRLRGDATQTPKEIK